MASVKVTNIPLYITEAEFKRFWTQPGMECQSCDLVKGGPNAERVGLVHFSTPQAASRALSMYQGWQGFGNPEGIRIELQAQDSSTSQKRGREDEPGAAAEQAHKQSRVLEGSSLGYNRGAATAVGGFLQNLVGQRPVENNAYDPLQPGLGSQGSQLPRPAFLGGEQQNANPQAGAQQQQQQQQPPANGDPRSQAYNAPSSGGFGMNRPQDGGQSSQQLPSQLNQQQYSVLQSQLYPNPLQQQQPQQQRQQQPNGQQPQQPGAQFLQSLHDLQPQQQLQQIAPQFAQLASLQQQQQGSLPPGYHGNAAAPSPMYSSQNPQALAAAGSQQLQQQPQAPLGPLLPQQVASLADVLGPLLQQQAAGGAGQGLNLGLLGSQGAGQLPQQLLNQNNLAPLAQQLQQQQAPQQPQQLQHRQHQQQQQPSAQQQLGFAPIQQQQLQQPAYEPARPEQLDGGAEQLPGDASATLYVDGMPLDITKREMAHIFRPFEGFKEIRIVDKKDRNGNPLVIGFAQFETVHQAAATLKTLQGYPMDMAQPSENPLRISFAKPLKPNDPRNRQPGPSTNRAYHPPGIPLRQAAGGEVPPHMGDDGRSPGAGHRNPPGARSDRAPRGESYVPPGFGNGVREPRDRGDRGPPRGPSRADRRPPDSDRRNTGGDRRRRH